MLAVGWGRDFVLLAALVLAGASGGSLIGHAGIGASCGALVYVWIGYRRMLKLHAWLLENPLHSSAPVHGGLLADIGDRITYLQGRLQQQLDETSDTLRYLRDSYSALRDGVVILGADNSIDWCNASAISLLRLRYPQDIGQPLINLMRNPDFARFLLAGEYDQSFELAAPGRQGRLLEVQATVFGEDSKVLFLRDVTALKRLETMRQDFLANISHEMRTPLTVITGYLDSLGELIPGQSGVVSKALEQMRQQATRMENLLRDLMLLSQLESGDHHRLSEEESMDLRPLLEMSRDNALTACSGQRRIELDCPPGLIFHGERVALESIVSNLVFNAVKYTGDGGHIRIGVRVVEGDAVLSVADDGIGIDPVHIPRLTERFYRVDKSRSLERGGTGLGLAIVKHALNRLDGELVISSRPGVGSDFSCRFPASRVTSAGPASAL